ncbi:MAG: hypothetical protein K8I00_05420 [Candidatus Omnitrophica bacterium]|nr:hypothetical protein [Candidatus Omnitrophota bacterium]
MKKICCVIACGVLLTGCASGQIVRSDILLDREMSRSIYVMPVVFEVTLDGNQKLTAVQLREQLGRSKHRVMQLLVDELTKRGYDVATYGKGYSDLDYTIPADYRMKEALKEYLHPTNKSENFGDSGSGIVESMLRAIFSSADITVSDRDGNKGKIQTKQAVAKGPPGPDPLMMKIKQLDGIIPSRYDTVLFVHIRSHIAKRGLFYNLREESTGRVDMTMINYMKEEYIFKDTQREVKTDILHWKSFKDNVANVLARIPLKL